MRYGNLLLTGGPSHDFAATSAELAHLLRGAGLDTIVVDAPDAALDALRDSVAGRGPALDLFTVFGLHWRMDQDRWAEHRAASAFTLSDADAALVREFVVGGHGLLALHTAVICFDGHPVWRELCGAVWDWERTTHDPVGPVGVAVTGAGRNHEVTAGAGEFTVEDEVYVGLDARADLEPLLVAAVDGASVPVLWTSRVGEGRVVTDLLGHGTESLRTPAHRDVLARAARWAAGGPAR